MGENIDTKSDIDFLSSIHIYDYRNLQ